jgi:ABC-type transporter Mla subunit MlaD
MTPARRTGQQVGISRRVARLTERLDRHRLALGILVAAVVAFLGYVAFVSTDGPPFQSRYQVVVEVPADAPPLRAGQAVRIGGKLAGLVSSVEPDPKGGGATVTANITKSEFRPLREDATANVRVHSIVYHTYLEIHPGSAEAEPMASGGTINRAVVTSGVDLLEVVDLFDEAARRSLQRTVINVGFGLAGRGDELNASLADLAPMSRNLSRQLRAATRSEGSLAATVGGSERVASALRGRRDDDVEALIGSGSAATGALAARESELAETLRRLPPLQDELISTAPLAEPLLEDLGRTAVELEPAVRGLNASLPAVTRLLGLGDVLRAESARIGAVTEPVLRTARPVVREMFPLLAAIEPLVGDVDRVVAAVGPYRRDIRRAGSGLAATTSIPYPQGRGPGAGAPMARVIPILTCHRPRNPFPGPGEALEDSRAC